MKKILTCLFLVLIMLFCTLSCSDSGALADDGRPQVVVTLFPLYDFVQNIGGDLVHVTMLLGAGAESHSYEPSPADIIKIAESDLFLCIGGVSETWVDAVLKSISADVEGGVNCKKLIGCAHGAPAVEAQITESHEDHEDHVHEHDDEESDEHIWLSPVIAAKMAQVVGDALAVILPDAAEEIAANTAAYLEKIQALDADYHAVIDSAEQKILVVGDRFPFSYLAGEYGLDCYAAIDGCGDDMEPSGAAMAALSEIVKKYDIPVIFNTDFSSGAAARTLCEETGAKQRTLYSAHTVTPEELKSGITYIDIMERNLEVLAEALNGSLVEYESK